jgi:hypothetical protein
VLDVGFSAFGAVLRDAKANHDIGSHPNSTIPYNRIPSKISENADLVFPIAEEEPEVIDEESDVIEVDLRFGQSFLRMSRVFDIG